VYLGGAEATVGEWGSDMKVRLASGECTKPANTMVQPAGEW
jgi:hypothetical protein